MPDRPSTSASASAADVHIGPLHPAEAWRVLGLLADAERALGTELVDEAEAVRLRALAADGAFRVDGWHPAIATVARNDADDDRDGATDATGGERVTVGYAAVVLPTALDGTAVGDAAVAHDAADRPALLGRLLDHLATTTGPVRAARLQVWARAVGDDDLAAAADAGFTPDRRLAVLGRALPVDGPAPTPPDGISLRGSVPGDDDEGIAAVLAGAYGDGPDGGWDVATYCDRTRLDWFRPEDVLVAEDTADGRLLGIHWLKRRSSTVGEVHNLAVHPGGQGRGLGPVLLRAGLDHLTAVGCDEVVLWVDRVNARAVAVYERAGFTTRWDDVALGRDLREP